MLSDHTTVLEELYIIDKNYHLQQLLALKEKNYKYTYPVKMLLQDLARKGPFSCTPARSCKILQDPVGSCGILQDFAGILQDSCTKFLLDSSKSHKILQDPAASCKILQDLAGVQEKRTFSCKILQERFYWVVLKIMPLLMKYVMLVLQH